MLCVNAYPQTFVDQCQQNLRSQLSAFDHLAKTAKASSGTPVSAAVDTLEPVFFNNLLLVLDSYFVHRSRTLEGKDGNALNEVRMLCASMVNHQGIFTADKAIKLDPARSLLKLHFGEEIRLSRADFERLAEAFFAQMEQRFGQETSAA